MPAKQGPVQSTARTISMSLYNNGAQPRGAFAEAKHGLAAAKAKVTELLKDEVRRRESSGAAPATVVSNTMEETVRNGDDVLPKFRRHLEGDAPPRRRDSRGGGGRR